MYPFIFPNGRCLTYALVNSLHEELCDQSDTTPTKGLEDGANEFDEEDEEENEALDNNEEFAEPVTPVPTPKVASNTSKSKLDGSVQKSYSQSSGASSQSSTSAYDIRSHKEELASSEFGTA